jgi:hypothetical protein
VDLSVEVILSLRNKGKRELMREDNVTDPIPPCRSTDTISRCNGKRRMRSSHHENLILSNLRPDSSLPGGGVVLDQRQDVGMGD